MSGRETAGLQIDRTPYSGVFLAIVIQIGRDRSEARERKRRFVCGIGPIKRPKAQSTKRVEVPAIAVHTS